MGASRRIPTGFESFSPGLSAIGGLPWVDGPKKRLENPEGIQFARRRCDRGIVRLGLVDVLTATSTRCEGDVRCGPFRVETESLCIHFPRLAPSSQPWAESCIPLGFVAGLWCLPMQIFVRDSIP